MIDRIPDDEGGKQLLKDKLNEVIDYLNEYNIGDGPAPDLAAAQASLDAQADADVEEIKSMIEPAGEYLGWKPVGPSVPPRFYMPPPGYVDEDGSPSPAMKAADQVPSDVRSYFGGADVPVNQG